MADLRIHDFPDDLMAESKSEASLDGDTLKAFMVEAAQREIERRRAMSAEERRQRRAQRRETKQ